MTPHCRPTIPPSTTLQFKWLYSSTRPRATPHPSPVTPYFRCQGGDLAKGNGAGGASISDAGPEILTNTGSNHHFAQIQSSFDSLQGAISKVSNLVSQLAASMGMQTTEVLPTESSLTVASAQFRSPATTASMFSGTGAPSSSPAISLSSPSDASATANVIPQVFAEMPQPYGFDNFNHQTVFRADGTEHSYFALPENYPLELGTPEPVFNVYDDKTDGCSNEFVHVFTSTPEQEPYEEDQQASDQLLKCVSKATELKTNNCLPEHYLRCPRFRSSAAATR